MISSSGTKGQGKGLDPLERSSDVRAQYLLLSTPGQGRSGRSSSIGTVSSGIGRSSQGQQRKARFQQQHCVDSRCKLMRY